MIHELDAASARAALVVALGRDGLPPDPELPEARAAVAVVVHPDEHGPAMLWIRRAEHPSDPWSGQMGFPGGRGEPDDEDGRATAERETLEEVGLELMVAGEHLGLLSPLTARNRRGLAGFRIEPHVYWIEELPSLALDAREVAAAHSIPLAHLADPRHATETEWEWRGEPVTLPGIDWEGNLLWGISFRILQDLLTRLGASEPGPWLEDPRMPVRSR